MSRAGVLRSVMAGAAALVAACGGQAKGGSEDIGHSSGGSSDTGGTVGSGGAGRTDGGAGAGGAVHAGGQPARTGGTVGAGGDAATCKELLDDEPLSLVVAITNGTRRTLHLGQELLTCRSEALFSVEDADGGKLVLLHDCRTQCDSVISGDPTGCPDICFTPRAVTLEPGEQILVPWNGLIQRKTRVPAQCISDGTTPNVACDAVRAVQPGTYRFSALAGSDLECAPNECAECVPRDDAGCETSGAVIMGELSTAEIAVRLDGGYGVGPSRGPGPPLPIELTFAD